MTFHVEENIGHCVAQSTRGEVKASKVLCRTFHSLLMRLHLSFSGKIQRASAMADRARGLERKAGTEDQHCDAFPLLPDPGNRAVTRAKRAVLWGEGSCIS